MNHEWSDANKRMQSCLNRASDFPEGIRTLLALREELFGAALSFREALTEAEFSAIPFLNADGYHSKTVAYSLWHIFRIEDIVLNTLIRERTQVFFEGDYQRRIRSPLVTTGNELRGMEIAEFSRQLDLAALYQYAADVRAASDGWLSSLAYPSLKQKIDPARREELARLQVVSPDENAAWLADYWLGKDVRGLIRMPFSRHWIMHIEAARRIEQKLRP